MNVPRNSTASLKSRVIGEISRAERARAQNVLFVTLCAAGLSLVGVLLALSSFFESFAAGDAGSYISLLFSDADLVARYWADFVFSLFDSLPTLEITALLCMLFVFLGSAKLFARAEGSRFVNA